MTETIDSILRDKGGSHLVSRPREHRLRRSLDDGGKGIGAVLVTFQGSSCME